MKDDITSIGQCYCDGWKAHVTLGHNLEIYGAKVQYCPWCGGRIGYEEKPLTERELKNVRELLKRACL